MAAWRTDRPLSKMASFGLAQLSTCTLEHRLLDRVPRFGTETPLACFPPYDASTCQACPTGLNRSIASLLSRLGHDSNTNLSFGLALQGRATRLTFEEAHEKRGKRLTRLVGKSKLTLLELR